jgi:PAS domain S-box-containing protein
MDRPEETRIQREQMRAEAILEAGVGIALVDGTDTRLRIRDINDALAELTGFDVDDLIDQPFSVLTGTRTDPQHLEALVTAARKLDSWRGMVILQDRSASPLPVILSIKPVTWSAADHGAAMLTILDATELYRAQSAQRLSNDITVLLSRRDDNDRLPHQLAQAMVRDFADWCAVHLRNDDGSLALAAIANRTGKSFGGSKELVTPQEGIGKVYQSGIPLHNQESHPENPALSHQMESITGEAVRSVASVPIASNSLETFGTITWAITDDRRLFHHEDIQAAEEVAIKFGHYLEEQRIRESLNHAIRAREGFMRAAGHELRTPLVSIKGYSQLLLRDVRRQSLSVQRLETGLHAIEASTSKLSDLMEDLFTVTNPDLNTLPMRFTTVDLGTFVKDFLATTPSLTGVGHEITTTHDNPPSWVRIDTTRFTQVLFNIVINAVHFSPPESTVAIRTWHDDTHVMLSIRDMGKGLVAGEEISIFDPFTQARSWHSSEQQGLGIGLHITRQIVERHGGEIWAESKGQDQGTTFTVRLPRVSSPLS